MLDKIKSLQEIIKPKANELGISFEEILEAMDDNIRFKYLEKYIFGKVTKTGLSNCFNDNFFKKCCESYHISYEKNIHKCREISMNYANKFNQNYTGKKELFFTGFSEKSPYKHSTESCYIMGMGTRCWEDSPAYNTWSNNILYGEYGKNYASIYKNLIENGAKVDNYLIVIGDENRFNQYKDIFKPYFKGAPDGYSYKNMVNDLFLSLVKNTKEISKINHWEVNQKYRDPFLEFLGDYSFWDLNDCKTILDIKDCVEDVVLKYKEWCIHNKYTFKHNSIDLSQKGMVSIKIPI